MYSPLDTPIQDSIYYWSNLLVKKTIAATCHTEAIMNWSWILQDMFGDIHLERKEKLFGKRKKNWSEEAYVWGLQVFKINARGQYKNKTDPKIKNIGVTQFWAEYTGDVFLDFTNCHKNAANASLMRSVHVSYAVQGPYYRRLILTTSRVINYAL